MDPQLELVEQTSREQQARDVAEPVLDDVTAVLLERTLTRATTSPSITSVLAHSGSANVVDTTTLRIVLIRSEYGSPLRLVQAGAKAS